MSDSDRQQIRMEQLGKATAALKLALQQPEDEFIRDSIIKRFELCFETARKAIRQWLMEQGEVPGNATQKEVMEAAFRTGLIADADLWSELTRWRNDSTHEYEEASAVAAAAFIRQRAVDAFDVLRNALASRT